MHTKDGDRVYFYDTTLRDGAQTQGVDFNVTDKIAIAEALDSLGIDYIEGGWPGSNPTDDALFANLPSLSNACFTAFGMTRKQGRSAGNDPGLAPLMHSTAKAVCLVGKAWDFHVDIALGSSPVENLSMIHDSVAHACASGKEVIFDAEHFFDGFKANQHYALDCILSAYKAGARWVTLCDTNGGTLPWEIEDIIRAAAKVVPGSHLGIHCHDDTGNAVANSLAAVKSGVRLVQGTLNGLGERCGNANLVSVIPSLVLKSDFETSITAQQLKHLTHVSRLLDEQLNRQPQVNAPYVGESAFAHKGGLHVSAIAKNPQTYEHMDPKLVGNARKIIVSDQAGRANIMARLAEIGLDVDPSDRRIVTVVEQVKQQEYLGYSYDGAEASFELLARRAMGEVPNYFRLESYRATIDRRENAKGELITESEARVTVDVGGERFMTVAVGKGPVNALDTALRKALVPIYPVLDGVRLADYKVRILTPQDATEAITRVMIETESDHKAHWKTVGVSSNIIDASYKALEDSIIWKLFHAGVSADVHAA